MHMLPSHCGIFLTEYIDCNAKIWMCSQKKCNWVSSQPDLTQCVTLAVLLFCVNTDEDSSFCFRQKVIPKPFATQMVLKLKWALHMDFSHWRWVLQAEGCQSPPQRHHRSAARKLGYNHALTSYGLYWSWSSADSLACPQICLIIRNLPGSLDSELPPDHPAHALAGRVLAHGQLYHVWLLVPLGPASWWRAVEHGAC